MPLDLLKQRQTQATAIISWVAAGVALCVMLALPVGYLTVGLRGIDALISAKAMVRAEKLSQIIVSAPDAWKLQQHSLDAVLQKNPTHDEGERSVVRDLQNELVAAFGAPPDGPTRSETHTLYDSGVVAGYLDVHYSMRPLLRETGMAAVVGFLLGAVIFLVFRQQPLRALDRALRTLADEQQHAAQLQLEKDEAETINRAKTEFLARVSHEIRTPMNGVLGMTELLSRTELSTKQRRFISTLRSSGESLLAIINDILDFSKIEAGKLVLEHIEFDLRQAVEDVVALLAEGAQRKGLSFTCRIADDVPQHLQGDPVRLRQILTNLANNAIKFTESGTVLVEVRRDAGRFVRFAVSDTGIGIAPEITVNLFQPFRQADNSISRKYGGTGLGLAIVKQLTELMGGTVGMDSAPGRGATFWFTLPAQSNAASATPAARHGEEVTPAPTAVRGARVLLAEDNPVNQEIALAMLEDTDYRVTLVENGRQVLAALSAGAFDAVLMDCQMPEMDGYEATRLLRRQEAEGGRRHTPIIGLTANAMSGDRERCLDAGMDDYVAKPFGRDHLLTVLARWTLGAAVQGASDDAAAAPPPADAAAIDPRVLQALRDLQRPGRTHVLVRVIDLFNRDAPGMMAEMRRAAAAGDAEGLCRAAHKLKSASANVGAMTLAARCGETEQLARSADIGAANALLAGAEDEIGRVLAALAQERMEA